MCSLSFLRRFLFYYAFEIGILIALAWFAHIGADRTAGYNLKSYGEEVKKNKAKKE